MTTPALELTADDDRLLERARQKDRDAIRLIIKQHNRRLYRIARSIVRNDSDAEDVLQEGYARAFAGLDGFRGEARLGTWLARIVINEALGCIRRRRPAIDIGLVSTSPTLQAQIIPFPDANRVPDPETTMVQSEMRVLLERAIDKLPSAFKTRLFRARALPRTEMEQHIGPVLGNVFPFAGERCERLTVSVLRRLGLS
jgi:RNA polymerase sigma-70 factor, ECF subfamily